MKKFDAIVIGSGQAGTPLVFRMASEGMKVAFIEKEHFGGTCLNNGCTPTKAYVASARRMWDAQHGDDLGIEIPEGAVANMRKIKERKDTLIKKSVDGIAAGVDKNKNITFFKGKAHFTEDKIIKVNEELLTAPEIYINVGGRPFIPSNFKDVPCLTSKSLLQLDETPEHLIIVGGSYIGLELGQIFKRFGAKVSILEKGDRIVRREDEKTSKSIQKFMEDDGVEFYLDSECISAEESKNNTITVSSKSSEREEKCITGSHLLLAVGRQPNTDLLQLENTNIKVNDRGYINVDDELQTNVPGIFALGDCNGEGAFTHTAYNDYEIIVANKFTEQKRKVSDRILIYGLFTDPPLGRVGMTKAEALDKGLNVLVGERPMSKISRAKEKGETHGYMSVVIDADSEKILGATVLGVGGDEIISGFTNIMYADGSYTIIRDSVQAHPTVSELIPTMLESVKKPD